VSRAGAALLPLLMLGCATSLEGQDVVALVLRVASEAKMCPGETAGLVVEAKLRDGEVLRTEGAGRGDVPWEDLAIRSSGAQVEDGVVRIDPDPRAHLSGEARVEVRSVHHRALAPASLTLPVHFACAFEARFDGAWGGAGMDGAGGADGDDGQDAPETGEGAADGGAGGHGASGGHGAPGDRGGRAPDVRIWIRRAEVPGQPRPMIQVLAETAETRRPMLVDPEGGSLFVSARGGDGGRGGNGGRGGDGGRGGRGVRGGTGGDGGNGGDGAAGGDAGDGGTVVIVADPTAQAFLGSIRVVNPGGAGGSGGMGGHGGDGGSASNGGAGGRPGTDGRPSSPGRDGAPGPAAQVNVQSVGPLW
jgi:hypothetical protein